MQAAVYHACGGPEQIRIEAVPRPEVGRSDVLVRVRACALNWMDVLVRRGPAPSGMTFPFWGGADVAGAIEATGADVVGLREGARVLVNPSLWCGACEWCLAGEESVCARFQILGDEVRGGMAELVSVPARNVLPIPEDFPDEEAAAVPLTFQTAWRALLTQGRIRPGQDVLILGASGGVGSAAVQIAKLAGARVFALTSSDAKAEALRRLGADEILDRRVGDFSHELLKRTADRGVDLVVENVGTPTWQQSLRCVARGGRLVSYGRTGGSIGETDIRDLFIRQIHISGSSMGSRRDFQQVMRLVFARRLRPLIDSVLPLAQARQAFERLESGNQIGKIVLRVA
ncbi:MAG: zinc-binding dehydrogenase [Myxococcales bacterium]|nr:zinc-binding dehydrogenase [Myxococcales bacterium]MDH5567185.1 zinc-binding dehydrogenase [Myxococcales bacterium]